MKQMDNMKNQTV